MRISSASISARGMTGIFSARACTTSGLEYFTAEEMTTTSMSGVDRLGAVAVGDVGAARRSGGASPRSRAMSEPLTRWPRVSSTSAMPLMPTPPMPTKWIRRGSLNSLLIRLHLLRHHRAAGRHHARRRIGHRRAPRRLSHRLQPRAIARQRDHRRRQAARRSARDRGSAPPAPLRRQRRSALARWWSSAANGYGTRIAGLPSTVSSATVVAPARQTTRSARVIGRAHVVDERRAPRRRTPSAGVARRSALAVGRTGLMHDAQAGDRRAQRRRRVAPPPR